MNDGDNSVVVEDHRSVRWIFLNRPHVHNAQTPRMIEQLLDAFHAAKCTPVPRVVVLAGKGKSFCSGHDMTQAAADREYRRHMSSAESRFREEQRLFVAPVHAFRDLPMPTLCMVRGSCFATGLPFAAAADFTIASETAVFGSPLISQLGLNDSETAVFPLRVGQQVAKRVLWLNEHLSAREALDCGLVSWVVPDDELESRVIAVADRLTQAPREALALSKATMRFMADQHGETAVERFHFMAHQLSHHTDETRQIFDGYLRDQHAGKSGSDEA